MINPLIQLTCIFELAPLLLLTVLLLLPSNSQNFSSLMFSKLVLLLPPSFDLIMEIVLHTLPLRLPPGVWPGVTPLAQLESGDLTQC